MKKERRFTGCLKENKKRRHAELDSASSTQVVSQNKQQRRAWKMLNQVQGDGPVYYNNNAFTLIELLVVVLIIGILAAVALPQYKFAVAKARMTQLVTLGNSVKQAEERYYLANGEYTNDFTVLDLELQGTPASNNRQIFSPSGWRAELSGRWVTLWDTRIASSGVRLYISFDNTLTPGVKRCYALTDNALANEICKHFTQKPSNGADGSWSVYYWYD